MNSKRKGKRKKSLVIESRFEGQIVYSNSGMRHSEEEETYYLKKGDKVYIETTRSRHD